MTESTVCPPSSAHSPHSDPLCQTLRHFCLLPHHHLVHVTIVPCSIISNNEMMAPTVPAFAASVMSLVIHLVYWQLFLLCHCLQQQDDGTHLLLLLPHHDDEQGSHAPFFTHSIPSPHVCQPTTSRCAGMCLVTPSVLWNGTSFLYNLNLKRE